MPPSKGSPKGYQRQAEPSKGNFLSWDAGESKDLVILSEKGMEEIIHWVDGESKECSGAGCMYCESSVKKTLRWTVLTECEGEELPWGMSNRTFFGVEDVAEMVGHLPGLRLRVTRHGTGMKTRYSVLPITGEMEAAGTESASGSPKGRNMAWYIEETKRLCDLAGMDPKQEYKLFFAVVVPGVTYATALDKLRAFYNYIDKQTKEFQALGEPPPADPFQDEEEIPF